MEKKKQRFKRGDLVIILDQNDLPYVGCKAIVFVDSSPKYASVDIDIVDGPPQYTVWKSRIRLATDSEKLEFELDQSLRGGEK